MGKPTPNGATFCHELFSSATRALSTGYICICIYIYIGSKRPLWVATAADTIVATASGPVAANQPARLRPCCALGARAAHALWAPTTCNRELVSRKGINTTTALELSHKGPTTMSTGGICFKTGHDLQQRALPRHRTLPLYAWPLYALQLK